ncbi:MAG: phage major capsid protein [Rikenellaceae bacterium]
METKTPEEIAVELKQSIEAVKTAKSNYAKAEEELKSAKGEVTEIKGSYEKAETELKKAKGELDQLIAKVEGKMSKMSKAPIELPTTYKQAISDALNTSEVKSGIANLLGRKSNSVKFEVKVSTATINRPVGNARLASGIDATLVGATPFYNLIPRESMTGDESEAVWTEADALVTPGYVEENTAIDSSITASLSASEKRRELGSAVAVIPVTRKFLVDNASVYDLLVNQGMQNAILFADKELLNGVGNDSTAPTKIYGLAGQATVFDADVMEITGEVDNPNLADAIMVANGQIQQQSNGQYSPTHVVMSVKDRVALSVRKDADGNPLVYRDYLNDGTMKIDGLTVITEPRLSKGEAYVVTQSAMRMYEKESFMVELERIPSTDSYVIYIWWRGQLVVKASEKKAHVKITTAGIESLAKVVDTDTDTDA